MRKISIMALMVIFAINVCNSATNDNEVEVLKIEMQKLSSAQKSILKDVENTKKDVKSQTSQISELRTKYQEIKTEADSISSKLQELTEVQSKDRTSFESGIQATNESIAANLRKMDTRAMWGGGLLALTILGFGGYLFVRHRNDSNSMNKVRKAQEALQVAQTKMQEDSVKLDNQMLMLVEKQMNTTPVASTAATETDHSLALKVADEIVRIELNLSRMDSSVKGYKQLSKAVERIKNNFQANGYEIVDMLGKPYDEGMKVVANFVPNDNLKEGDQIITGVTKPQVNYNGKMIQSAQITVSQNI